MRPMMGWARELEKPPEQSLAIARRVFAYARPYRVLIVTFIGLLVVSAALAAAQPLVMRSVIDDALLGRDGRLLNILAAVLIGIVVVQQALSFVERFASSRIGEGVIFDLRTALYDHVLAQPLAFFTRTQTGALISRVNGDVIGAQRLLTGTLGSVVSNVIRLVTTAVVMALIDWRLTLLAVALLPAFLVPARRVGRRLARFSRESMQLNAAMSSVMQERFNVGGALLTKLFGTRRREASLFDSRAARVRDIGVKTAVYGVSFFAAVGLVMGIGTAVVYWLGGRYVLSGRFTVGTVVAFSAYLAQLYGPLTALTNARIDVLTALVSFERVFEVLDHRPAIEERSDAIALASPARGEVRFDHVGFAYPDPAAVSIASLEETSGSDGHASASEHAPLAVLHDISFAAAPGQVIALVGPSGAGKTTIASLIPRLYDVSSGSVTVNGNDVRALTQDSLRGSIGVVTQDAHLFHDTVLNNLLYAAPDATFAEIKDACRAAHIDHVITAMPEGYDTMVGERGYRLSGGEKQRLAIARVLLAKPAIVILDEATAHLDSESEAHIQAALASALAGRTSVVIAHRLSTITNADRILVIDGGRVVEDGRHEDLIELRGLYSRLYERQVARSPVGQPAR